MQRTLATVPALVASGFFVSSTLLAGQAAKPSDAAPRPEPEAAAGSGSPGLFDLRLKLVDRTGDPCKDFYQYACGNWLKENPVPAEYSIWGRFHELDEKNQTELKTILEAAAANAGAAGPNAAAVLSDSRDATRQKIGDYYAACMDEARAEAAGVTPVGADLALIAAVKSPAEAVLLSARLRRGGVKSLFSFDSDLDAKDSTKVIAEVDQGGLGLPDKDDYLKDDARSKELRAAYVAHVTRLFILAGDTEDVAAAEAKRVMSLETALANGSMSRVDRRDPEKTYHPTLVKDLGALAPSLPWKALFEKEGVPGLDLVNVVSPGYFKALDALVKSVPVDDFKSYLRWQALHEAAPRLSKKFVDENFAFYGKTLTGAAALKARWKRCVAATDRDLRDLLGKPFVDATFGEDGKKRMLAMVKALEAAMGEDLKRIDWMDDETRARATAKLDAIVNKIGFPDRWVDRSKIVVTRSSWIENARTAARFEHDREVAKIGKPYDRMEWRMTPPTVNASYNPSVNQITFPAGILQPPFFDKRLDDATNYGAIGGVIGHEITHGFDDQGSQFDKDGNLKNWWTERSAKEFARRAGCVAQQFDSYAVEKDLHVNGKLTLGENIGDLGGLKIAFAAMKKATAGNEKTIGGMTDDQRFFLAWAQGWCRNITPEEARLRVRTDPHAPGDMRVKGPFSNLSEFRSAFHCDADSPMVRKPEETCEVW